jgi:predicted dithiol-disulfide oxidoreductase (DUF899 family)
MNTAADEEVVKEGDLTLLSESSQTIELTRLLFGVDALVILFLPFTYGEREPNTMENLVYKMNQRLDKFVNHDLKVICVGREPPCTLALWKNDRGLHMNVYSDLSLSFAKAFVGTFDLAGYISATKNVQMDSFQVCVPGVVILGGDGKVIGKYIAASPGNNSEITIINKKCFLKCLLSFYG